MDSVLVVNLDINDLRAAIIKKMKELLSGSCSGISVGINVNGSGVVAGLVLEDQHLRDSAIEYARGSLEKNTIGPVTVEFINTEGKVMGAKVNFKWGGK